MLIHCSFKACLPVREGYTRLWWQQKAHMCCANSMQIEACDVSSLVNSYYYMIELKLSSIGNKEVIGIHWHDEGACGMFLSWEVMVFVWDVTVSNSKADIIPVYLFVPSLNPNHGVKLSRNTLQDIHIIAAALILLMNRNLICNVAPTLRTGPSIVRRLRPEIRQQKQPKT